VSKNRNQITKLHEYLLNGNQNDCRHPLHENNDFIKSMRISHTYNNNIIVLKSIYQILVETFKS